MRTPYSAAVAAAFLALAGPAAASPAVDASTRPIVVTGSLDGQVRAYVGALVKPTDSGRIARFEKAVCPAAYGLSAELNGAITKRMRTVAQAAGLTVAPSGCAATILLFVPKDRKQLLAQLRRDRPELFGRMTGAAVDELAASSEAAIAWHVHEERGADGRSLAGGWREGQPMVQEAVTSSRLLASGRTDLAAAVVVLDTQAALGLTPTELADYALMRALVESKGGSSPDIRVPTILTIFRNKQAGEPAPLSLTEWDLAFLKAFHGMSNILPATAQRTELEQLMKRSLPESPSAR